MKKLGSRVQGQGFSHQTKGMEYDHAEIEAKWQSKWIEAGIYEPDIYKAKNPFYNLMMFPYPSGEGLHVGHAFAFSGADIYGRFKRMHGADVFEPIGFDSFGIHSENYALKIGEHPKGLIEKTTNRYESQLKSLGLGFSWKQKLSTSDIDYYKWTQWVFVRLFKAGLAYRAKAAVNWCPNCLTVLADEQVIAKQVSDNSQNITDYGCERCGTTVKKKDLTQWFFRITAYADRLLNNLEKLDWSDKIVVAQRNWIGKSKGAKILFQIDIENGYSVAVFTTRPDTIYGVTYLALAPAHPLVTTILKYTKGLDGQHIREFVDYSFKKLGSVNKNQEENKEKNGIFSGFYAKNPLNGKKIPVYIADYVLMGYGSGAVMGVPAHDDRDWEFAKKYGIEVLQVVKGKDEAENDISRNAFTEYGVLVNSGEYSGLTSSEAILKITEDLPKKKVGEAETTWHLRDWIISRQRYWGPPIPMIFCEKCAKEAKSWFTQQAGPVGENALLLGYSLSRDQRLVEDLHKAQVSQNSEIVPSRATSPRSKSDISNLKLKIKNSEWESAGWYPVPEENLPVELPYMENFKPTGIGVSPLGQNEDFVKVKCPGCGAWAKRETDVSDTFLDSAWYFLRYPSVEITNSKFKIKNFKADLPWDPEITKRWLPVDMYIGGAEHAVLHLLYSRFVTMAFADLGLVDFEEPFPKFRAHGMVIKDGAKMSKSRGNVVVPDDYINKFGADTLRCYLMFCGRYSDGGDFRDSGIFGMQKFLKRVWKLVMIVMGPVDNSLSLGHSLSRDQRLVVSLHDVRVSQNSEIAPSRATLPRIKQISSRATQMDKESTFMMNKTIKKVTDDIENLDYNTAIAAMMEWLNFLEEQKSVSLDEIGVLLKLLAPFAPHMTEELWQRFVGGDKEYKSIHLEKWPQFDEKLAISQMAIVVVQVNGKLRDKIEVERGIAKDKVLTIARELKNVAKYLSAGKVVSEIYVADKLINFVVT